jgi:cytochrome P450
VRLRYQDGRTGWLVTSHALAKAVLKDRRIGVRGDRYRPHPIIDPELSRRLAELETDEDFERKRCASFLFKNPPDHTRFRMLFTGNFSVRSVADMRAHIEHIVEERLDAMAKIGPPVDLVEVFAIPVSIRSQCALLGASREDAEEIARLNAIGIRALEDTANAEAFVAAEKAFRDRVLKVIEEKRSKPTEDIISRAVLSGELSDDEIVSVVEFILTAGQDVSGRMIAMSLFALLAHRSQFDALRRGEIAIDGAVEELLRYVGVFQVATLRIALEDLQLEDTTIKAGEHITVSLQAANRDPRQFEDPDTLTLERSARGHLAFGQGIHVCLGQHLARLEMRVALEELIRRFPCLRLAVPPNEVPTHSGRQVIYGVRELPVAW